MKTLKELQIRKFFCFVLFLLVWVLFTTDFSISSTFQDYKNILFSDAEKAKVKADSLEAEVYSPEQYKKASKYYSKAKDAYKDGKNPEKFKDELKMAEVYFLKSVEIATLFRTHISDCVKSRNAALKAKAEDYNVNEWKKAENELNNTAGELEDGNLDKAIKKSKKAMILYGELELKSIKNKVLSGVLGLIKKAEDEKVEKYASITLAESNKLINQADRILTKNRYDTVLARRKAIEAKYEVKHAAYLAGFIKKLEERDREFETVLLDGEKPLKSIAGNFEIDLLFDNGYDQVVYEINSKIEKLKKENESINQELSDAREQIELLGEQIHEMESEMGDLKSKKETLSQLVEQQKKQKEYFLKVEKLFEPKEAKIFREGSNVIVRLYGLSFPSGKSIIESKYFGMLTKVLKAIRVYPECTIIVEGHTDSWGSDKVNQKLSTKRAEAVMDYLVANSDIDPVRITAEGYGETKPVASNETQAGRSKNRRIDILIEL